MTYSLFLPVIFILTSPVLIWFFMFQQDMTLYKFLNKKLNFTEKYKAPAWLIVYVSLLLGIGLIAALIYNVTVVISTLIVTVIGYVLLKTIVFKR